MADADILKAKRTSLRTAITNYCKKIESELTKTEVNVTGLEEMLELLEERAEILKCTDKELEIYLKSDECDREFEKVDEYREKITLWKFRAKKRLEANNKSTPSTSNPRPETHPEETIQKEITSVKLPKLSIPKFYGDSSQWLNFWNSFQSAIHNNESLNKIDKFNYLKAYLGSTALNTAEGFSLSEENYDVVIKLLTERFGRKDILINAHMSNLLSIPPLKYSNDVKGFRIFFDKCQTQIRSLESLNVVADSYGSLLCPMLLNLLPQDLVLEFNKTGGLETEYKVKDLMDFLLKELNSRERTKITQEPPTPSRQKFVPSRNDRHNRKYDATAAVLFSQTEYNNRKEEKLCVFCNESHKSQDCKFASSLSLNERRDILRKKGICFKCLMKQGHLARECKSKQSCSVCGYNHMSIMCVFNERKNVPQKDSKQEIRKVIENSSLTNNSKFSEVYLQTLIVRVHGKCNDSYIRGIIDTGSQNSYMSKYAIERLRLKCLRQETVNHGLFGGVEVSKTHSRYLVQLSSIDKSYSCEVEVLDEKKICSLVPKVRNTYCIRELRHRGIYVSDIFENEKSRIFQEDPQEIHLLLGADIAGSLFTGEIEQLTGESLLAMKTKLGWTLLGRQSTDDTGTQNTLSGLSLSLHVSDVKLADLWRLDTLGISNHEEDKDKGTLEKEAEEYFLNTVKRNEDGRYEVSLPWILDNSILPSNLNLSEKYLHKTEKKLVSSNKREEYNKVFDYWESNDITECVSEEGEYGVHYLPHRPVIKETSQTTKIRPVFNASARGKNSPSLNDCLATGPNLIEVLPSVLNRFRKYRVAVSADIEKAFLQICIREADRDFLRFLWFDAEHNLKTYRHKRVVFGLTSSPFLLAATLNHHLNHAPERMSETVHILRDSFYVDNSLTSFNSVEETGKFIEESKSILSPGHFNLRCWRSNMPNPSINETESEEKEVPILGLIWNVEKDTLAVKIDQSCFENAPLTKRKTLSLMQRIFDPIGFTVPITLVAKMILQETWILKLKWDDELPEVLDKRFKKWVEQLISLPRICVPRWLNMSSFQNETLVTLHVFCDASQRAYATCVYLRVEATTGTRVQLVNSRNRLAPLKPMTIPRLELLSCLIGTRLAATVLSELKLSNVVPVYWSDSSTALGWIRRNQQWGTFVHNRVQEIRSLSDPSLWRHVPGNLNPADLPSRGCSAEQLLKSRWWEGPSWLYLSEAEWPQTDEHPDEELVNQEKRKTILISKSKERANWYYRYFSTYTKIVRLIAWILRFYHNISNTEKNSSSDLSVAELEKAEKSLYRLIQEDAFEGLKDKTIRSLRPIAGQDGILRVKTNVIYRKDTEDFRYPVILPSKHPVVRTLIFEKHVELQHAGVAILMAHLRDKYWILKSRKTIRNVISKCVKCQRFRVQKTEAEPGIPPEDRVRDASVFEVVGVDLAGPLYLKGGKKAWIVLFTCAVYRAVHLELITSLSTPSFIQALRRFIARRGKPHVIYSDNGTNFVGTERALCGIDWDEVLSVSTTQRIRWKFNPPSAAWWGGWWERLIGMVKGILRRVLGKASLDYEELVTILCDCEQVINSRPLSYISEDTRDPTPLSPSMFLHELPSSGIPDIDAVDCKELTKRAKHRQRIRDILRSRFRNEYLGQLRQRPSKGPKQDPIKVGDVVLLEDVKKQRVNWPLAKVVEIFPGRDNVVRVAKVKIESGVLLRPVQKLYRLELLDDESVVPVELPIRTRVGRIVRSPQRLKM